MKRKYLIFLIPVLTIFVVQIFEIELFYKQLFLMFILFFVSVLMLCKTLISKENSIIRVISAIFSLTIIVCLYFWIEQSSILEFIF